MAEPVTFGGGFAQGLTSTFAPTFSAFSQSRDRRDKLELQREQATAKTRAENIKKADGFIKQFLDILAAGGTLSPGLVEAGVATAIQLNPDEQLKYQEIGKTLAGIPATSVRGSEGDIKARDGYGVDS